MNTSRRRWNWASFVAGFVVGIPSGAVGLVVLAQIITAMTGLP